MFSFLFGDKQVPVLQSLIYARRRRDFFIILFSVTWVILIYLIQLSKQSGILQYYFNLSHFSNAQDMSEFHLKVREDLHLSISSVFPEPPPRSILHYIKIHSELLDCFAKAECDPEFLIWRCPGGKGELCSGAGDRFRGILSAFSLALYTERVFLIDWPDKPYPLHYAMSPSLIDWRIPPQLNLSHSTLIVDKWPIFQWENCSIHLLTARGHCDPSSYDQPANLKQRLSGQETINFDKLFNKIKQISLFTTGSYSFYLPAHPTWGIRFSDFRPNKNNLTIYDMNRILMKCLFAPSISTQKMLKNTIPKKMREQGYVGIHARTGLDLGEQNINRFWGLQIEHKIIASRFLSCAQTSGLRPGDFVFFASDSTALKNAFLEVSLEHGVRSISTNVSAFHIAKNDTSNRHLENRTVSISNHETWLAFMNVFVEFFGLAGAKMIISNRSEFSRFAYIRSDAILHKSFNVSNENGPC